MVFTILVNMLIMELISGRYLSTGMVVRLLWWSRVSQYLVSRASLEAIDIL